ncbi:MAG: TonB-dependent receptor [Bacteroidetes bacterium]|nr:TonB-dependent receptor [Bacteroidota bacterium]MBS1930115.1 TonB-dependent receptor [Bacteroidota bacterium]
MRRLTLLILIVCSSFFMKAQMPGNTGGNRNNGAQQITGSFYGKLVNSQNNKPVEFASVELIQNKFDTITKKRKDVVIAGMLTKANGDFNIENIPLFGQYKLHVTAIGFKEFTKVISFDFKMGNGSMNNNNSTSDPTAMLGALSKDLGNIKMDVDEKVLSNVTITSSKPGLELAIDKKVFNVEKNISSIGGTAVDVMRNVPSLNVDIDGNVTLRNNAPQILVDGRPTTLTLDQIPADAIESVEIITNPSAKYDASGGTSGILNIVLKKNRKVGYNGNIRVNADSRGRVGGGGDINLRQGKINFSASGNYFPRKSISNGTTDRLTLIGNPNTELQQTDNSTSIGNFKFFRSGLDYFVDNRNTISLAGNIGGGHFQPYTLSQILIDSLYAPTVTSSFNDRSSNTEGNFHFKGGQFSFKHNFPKSGHNITADINYNASKNDNSNLIETDYYTYPQKQMTGTFSQKQNIYGNNSNWVIQSDYTNPLTENSKFEAGLRASVRNSDSKNDFYFFDANNNPVYNALLSTNYISKEQVYAAYSTFSNQIKNFGYQVGLRVESSNYEGHLPDKNQDFKINFPVSLFPSFFLSQKLKNDQEFQINYTRRINRPNPWQLNPFTDYSDSLNISRGNPNLKPEFTNSVELTYNKTFRNRDNFLASIYYKNTNDLITRYQVTENDVINNKEMLVNSYINANSSYVTGLELISKNKINKWWDLTSNLNLYTSKININDPNQPKQDQFVSWFGKLNNTFKLPKNFTLQISGDYQSKTILPPGGSNSNNNRGFGGMFGAPTASQGYVRATYGVDAAVKFEFLKEKRASISLNVNDIFRTRTQDIHSESAYFVQDAFRRRDAQIFRLNFNWRFGKFDASLFKRKNMKNQENGMDNMNMGGMGNQ